RLRPRAHERPGARARARLPAGAHARRPRRRARPAGEHRLRRRPEAPRAAGGEAMAVTTAARVHVRPILAPDVRAAAEFLHAHLNERVPAAAWPRALATPWEVEAPNARLLLLDGD